MKHTRKFLPALAIGAFLTTPIHAVPIVFEFAGTVSQQGVVDYRTGEQLDDAGAVGTAWSAQFVVETDLFGPLQTGGTDLARMAGFAGLPGAVTPSLTIGGVSLDVARLNTDTSELRVSDSLGLITYSEGSWAIQPDQWGVNFRSREVTPLGIAGLIDLQMSFVDVFNSIDLTGGTSMLSLEDINSPLSLAMLPLDNPLWFRDVEYTVENYSCVLTCAAINREFWALGVTSVTRTVGMTTVPEPGTLTLLLAGLGGALGLRRRRSR
jgi:hypothetical protein